MRYTIMITWKEDGIGSTWSYRIDNTKYYSSRADVWKVLMDELTSGVLPMKLSEVQSIEITPTFA